MLETIGVSTMEALFEDIPEGARFPELALPPALTELEIASDARHLAGANIQVVPESRFLGAGAYSHFIPATVRDVLRRSEFYTSYTPYQPEISQGMLQAMFEYQSMICRLTAMEVSNASHYDGATSLAEAVLLALDAARGSRRKIVLSPFVHPQYRAVVKTYLRGTDALVVGDDDPAADPVDLRKFLEADTAAVVIQNPNFLGHLEDTDALSRAARASGALLIVVADPISLGLFRPPGAYGADVVVADGQPLGIPACFGGPHLGIFATRKAYIRRLVGRLVGETVDAEGKRGYVLTLGTREQHIRRAKATSNICTNAALTALAAAVYLATMGKSGLRRVAQLCYQKSHYAAQQIQEQTGLPINPFAPNRPFFKEFVVELGKPVETVNTLLLEDFGILGGYDLGQDYPAFERHMLIAVTEMNTKESIDRLVEGLRRVAA
jgi:glycine dehydrogenase subunit 1